MNRWVDDPMNEKNKSIASQENYYKGLNQGCMKMKGWRFIAKLSGMVVDKILEETEDGINITNRRLVFTCCYNEPIKHSGALWLGTGPLSQGWGRGSLPVLLRPDSLLQPHFKPSLCGAIGMDDVKLAD